MEHRINTDSALNQLWLCARQARERERERTGVRVSDCNVFTGRIAVRVDTLTLMGDYHCEDVNAV